MALFESTLLLLFVAIVLLYFSRRLSVPYPTMLAVAGATAAALPWAPVIVLEPRLALALFVAPSLLDSAYDLPPRDLRREWISVLTLALLAVVLTTAAVAWAGWAIGGLPAAAAITLGAIVAPPDAAAANAILRKFDLPRPTLSILQGESLLNDAVALLIFGSAYATALSPGHLVSTLPMTILAVPGGLVFGWLLAKIQMRLASHFRGTLSFTILQFVATFSTWILAEHLHLSPILAVVAFAMTIAPASSSSARERIHSYSVWEAVVFLLNVLAFLFMGLQARVILGRLEGPAFTHALGFAAIVVGLVVVVRIAWVMATGALLRRFVRAGARTTSRREDVVIAWSGMRGLVTLATSFALPPHFPGRDTIVLAAFAVVLGTLVGQGLTLGPLLRWLELEPDSAFDEELSFARSEMITGAIASLAHESGPAADAVRGEYEAALTIARDASNPLADTEHDRLRRSAIAAERRVLRDLRRAGRISDDAFHRLEEELDWSEMNAAPAGSSALFEG